MNVDSRPQKCIGKTGSCCMAKISTYINQVRLRTAASFNMHWDPVAARPILASSEESTAERQIRSNIKPYQVQQLRAHRRPGRMISSRTTGAALLRIDRPVRVLDGLGRESVKRHIVCQANAPSGGI